MPLETIKSTFESRFTDDPEAGVDEITNPAGISELKTSVTAPIVKGDLLIATWAASGVNPVVDGIV